MRVLPHTARRNPASARTLRHVLVLGPRSHVLANLTALAEVPGLLTCATSPPAWEDIRPQVDVALVLVTEDITPALPPGVPWIAWNLTGGDTASRDAYERGARAVLPAGIGGVALTGVLEQAMAQPEPAGLAAGPRRRIYAHGTPIGLGEGHVLRVELVSSPSASNF